MAANPQRAHSKVIVAFILICADRWAWSAQIGFLAGSDDRRFGRSEKRVLRCRERASLALQIAHAVAVGSMLMAELGPVRA